MALVELHVSVVVSPLFTGFEAALRVAVGTGDGAGGGAALLPPPQACKARTAASAANRTVEWRKVFLSAIAAS